MYAFLVCKEHIDAMLTAGLVPYHGSGLRWMAPAELNPAAYQRGEPWGPEAASESRERRRELTERTAGRTGAMLMAENAESVNHRYDEEDIEEPYVYARPWRTCTPVEVLKLIDCYEYQTCEHPEWERSEARAFCEALRGRMIGRLEGYDGADWEFRTQEVVREQAERQAKAEAAREAAKPRPIPGLVEGSGPVTAAKNIRKELAEAFPGVKFSVRCSRFSGGNSIDVSWTDGPTSNRVEAIIGKYKDGDFDGMTDSYNYLRDDWTAKYGGAKYVHTRREHSDKMVSLAIDHLGAEYGRDRLPTVEDYRSGKAYNWTPIIGAALHRDSWQSLIGRWLDDATA